MINNEKKRLLIIIIVLLIACAALLAGKMFYNPEEKSYTKVVEYEYDNDYMPNDVYKVKIDFGLAKADIEKTSFCSAVNCPPTTTQTSVYLTKYQLDKLMILTDNNDFSRSDVTEVLESLSRGDAEFTNSTEEYNWDEECVKADKNKDNILTYREYAEYGLELLTK